jgi:hypothetical protein
MNRTGAACSAKLQKPRRIIEIGAALTVFSVAELFGNYFATFLQQVLILIFSRFFFRRRLDEFFDHMALSGWHSSVAICKTSRCMIFMTSMLKTLCLNNRSRRREFALDILSVEMNVTGWLEYECLYQKKKPKLF